ncbi:hypothetical protein [Nocardia sp. NPDC003345]
MSAPIPDRANALGRELALNAPGAELDTGDLVVTRKSDYVKVVLRRAAAESGLSGGQIVAKSGLPRSTVYRYLQEDNTTFPRDVTSVVRFLQACRVPSRRIKQAVTIWHTLNGTGTAAQRPEDLFVGAEVIDAELVAPEHPGARDSAEHLLPSGHPANSGVHISGNVGGNIVFNVLSHKPAVPEPDPETIRAARAARMRGYVNTLTYAVVTVVTLCLPILTTLDFGYRLFTTALPAYGAALIGGGAYYGVRLARRRKAGGSLRVKMTRLLSGRTAFGLVAGVFGGLAIGEQVTWTWELTRYYELSYDECLTRGTLVGLAFGLTVVLLVIWWLQHIDWVAVYLLSKQFPALPILVTLAAIGIGIWLDIVFDYSTNSTLVIGFLVFTVLLLLLDKLIAQITMSRVITEQRDEVIRLFTPWRTEHQSETTAGVAGHSKALDLLNRLSRSSTPDLPTEVPGDTNAETAAELVEDAGTDSIAAFCADLLALKQLYPRSYREMHEIALRRGIYPVSKTSLANAVNPRHGLPTVRTVLCFVDSLVDDGGECDRLLDEWDNRWLQLSRALGHDADSPRTGDGETDDQWGNPDEPSPF